MRSLQVFALCLFIAQIFADTKFIKINENQQNIQKSFKLTPRISNGDQAGESVFPWHVLLVIQNRNENLNTTAYCGGAILNEKWILTAADCVVNARNIRIDVGSVKIDAPARSVYPDAFTVHPQFNSAKFKNNLALLRLSGTNVLYPPNEETPRFAPIRLPQRRQKSESFERFEAYFSSFGETSLNNKKNVSDTLLFSEQRIIPNTACVGFYDNDLQLITPKVICSSSVDMRQGACAGDSGAPLVINEFGSYTLIGIMSFMHRTGNCGQQPVPAVFTRITSHFDWIAQITHYQFRP